ncbi:M18 family aminopeptidase [Spirochaetia bacterium]|nr:M18 family aminopeptidase [Spirochaetia bacterium]
MTEEAVKTQGQLLTEKLSFSIKNCWETASPEERQAISQFAEQYKNFLAKGKTEREFTAQCVSVLKREGFITIEEALKQNGKLAPGSKVYQHVKGKSLVFAIIGTKPLQEGVNILSAHVDSPRIDLKTNPLYEDSEFALFDTQYYGGIKPYQWTAIPLALHGVVITKNGERRDICVGEDEEDPVFTITDLLPHFATDQMQKKASEFISGEELDILAGSEPFTDDKAADKVKLTILHLLYAQYGMTEEDFASAEITFVPAGKLKDVGLDRSMIGGYGHDDKCCAYTAFYGALYFVDPNHALEKTIVCLLTDKEEDGGGNTGPRSRYFENFLKYLYAKVTNNYMDIDVCLLLSNSSMLTADVNAAYDPNYSEVYDKKTAPYFGKGIALSKSGTGNDANAEYCQKVQGIFNRNNIRWQYGGWGTVDKGGAGTIACIFANLGIDVLDCGIPVLSMHSPFEVISKIDLYTAYKGYKAFLKDA